MPAQKIIVVEDERDIQEIIERFAEDLDANRLPTDLRWFKAAIEDAKSYYVEALTAQPGSYDTRQTYSILWHETQLGAALRQFHDGFLEDPGLAGFARIVLPRDALEDGAPQSNATDTREDN